MKKIIYILILFAGYYKIYAQDTLQGSRNPWEWPFTQNSIWNQPIGSNALYVDANLEPANNVDCDIQHILELSDSYPERQVLGTEVWGPGRCDGTYNLGFTLKVPDDWLVPDAGNSPYGTTPNSNFAFKLPNSNIIFEGNQVSRCVPAGPVYLPRWMNTPSNRNYQSLKSDGLNGGGQGASGMSALGGTIRKGEFSSDAPIRHAIKINPWAAKYCYYHDSLPGYKWPATSSDSYAVTEYKGSNPYIVMGTLFAIPPDITIESLGIETIPGKKLFFTMQNYGVYFTEDAYWDTWDIIVERDVELEFENTFGFSIYSKTWGDDLNKLMTALSIIINNSPNQIGGGGIPLQPLAPNFCEVNHYVKDSICDGDYVEIGDSVFTKAGNYKIQFTSKDGCDSIVNLNLTVNSPHNINIYDSICLGDSLQIGELFFSEPNTYKINLLNQFGCDSIITLNLFINSINTLVDLENNILTSEQKNATYKWLDCNNNFNAINDENNQSYIVTKSGNYAVEVTKGQCIDTSNCYTATIKSSNIDYNNFGSPFKVYPNPTEHTIEFELGSHYNDIYLKISNIRGQLLQKKYIGSTNKFKYNITVPNGIYIFQINTKEGKQALLKIVKQ